jgi:luciferase family oxidoreductase group 1
MTRLALSVLDQSPIPAGGDAPSALRSSIELARLAERLGYRRYWVAEHHSSGGLAGSSPEILIARIAAATERIRVGSGGVMLSHYSPLKVAENFRVLEALYPGRIDLGIGRAPGSDRRTAAALAHGPGALGIEHFGEQIADLAAYLHDQLPAEHPFADVRAMPAGPSAPPIWLLGSSDQSAAYAAHLGLAFSFAQFINPQGGPQVMAAYKQYFRPSQYLSEPTGSVGISVICAETAERAEELAGSIHLWRLKNELGQSGPVPSLDEVHTYPYTDRDRAHVERNRPRTIVGDPPTCRARLEELAERYGVDEMVIVTIVHDQAARFRSYELLAEAFELAPLG